MKIAVFGAGSIGVYIGTSLLAAGGDVLLVGRSRMRERIARHDVLLTDLQGRQMKVHGSQVPYEEDAAAIATADLILVTVKSADTPTAANAIAAHAKPSALVLSLQNGVGNVDVMRARLSDRTVLGGMVPFNVVQMTDGRLHRGTAGELMVEASPAIAPWHALFRAAHLPLMERDDFAAVQWGKLLLNLNNAVNALSGLPLKTELSQRAYRRCLALLIEEALKVLRAAGIRPAKVARVAPHLLPMLMRLPDAMFTRIAASMLRIDPEARSSMWEDLQAGRRTEVNHLNGAVVALAKQAGMDAPFNRRMVELVHAVESRGGEMQGPSLYRALKTGMENGGTATASN
ncbi:2-dehydropantoate 2-reductase [Noviherbaspirillum cavernae]|uniref:2-dehydropantoate 2-reductase n=1 Tax=Noviherbaspirillum cavernae TaxID=2320862 RepID=A0A418WYW5_9BURK|nr:2-dehydropantoate 2-reductase [Noviherbaspirillum cavernae]RJG05406.1 2-dehydropantoate 2-reductase [Noviherbaspirillum cavernae]